MKNQLADKRQVTLILRLTLDEHGQFMHGEVVDLDGNQIGRFNKWRKLLSVLQIWVADQEEENTLNFPRDVS